MNNKDYIINGPYLLGLNTTNVTIAWETFQIDNNIKLVYFSDDEEAIEAKILFEKEPSCKDYIDGCYLCTSVLDNLQENKKYIYKIYQGDCCLVEGSVKTLAKSPEKLKIITVSDSHLFNTNKAFSTMIENEKPDFILHSGDISFGTGYQREQYEQNWFRKIPDILKNYGVYYVPGNHDDGVFFETLFINPQLRDFKQNNFQHNYSFNYGNTHFVFVDSNPWGLFEMNAINSGLEADNLTKKNIFETLRWIDEDLKSKEAIKSKWRILILHHPYTDTFNNKYIVPLVEANNVDLVISGHLHYYTKAVSVNPERGANTIYISQGSLQEAELEIEKNTQEKRLLGDFPEVVAIGKNNYGILEINSDSLCYNLCGFDSLGIGKVIDNIYMNKKKSQLSINEVEIRRLDNLGNVEIRAEIKNNTDNLVIAKIELVDNNKQKTINLFGNKENKHIVLLNKGEKQKLTTIYQAKEQGEHRIIVEDVETEIIVYEPMQLSFEHMKVFAGKEDKSNYLLASIEATNNLDREALVSIPLYINQRIAETKNVFFRGHEKKYIEFQYKFNKCGNYQISIADQLPKDIYIEGGIRIVPRIHDKSGNGHYALLHGTPKVKQQNNQAEVYLEQYGDYIEIPANSDFMVDDAFCGMVWANVDRLAKNQEMGHNPLMVKGKSVGWGATYLMRMVIERAGGLKWGVCHDITEYSWQGGQASIGEWAQYTMSFDKQKGGNSYVNGKLVAHIGGINKDSELRQWEKEPIFVGYSYIGHVIPEINRPKYFTHLPAKISQVRFYKKNISAKDNKYIYNNPKLIGPKEKDLALWLDFKDILTIGKHITEWRHPAIFNPEFKTEKIYWFFKQLKVQAIIPMQANIRVTVEVSDDAITKKNDLVINLKNGTNYIDLSVLKEAQYIRIITEMSAEVGNEGTFIPEVKEYQVTAYNENIFTDIYWSTRADWECGSFTGAIGFAPVDRLKDYPEYTDIIHG